jgi:ElaB/YqjD/DUF883 family membrane-anchored ribosome-binding protein
MADEHQVARTGRAAIDAPTPAPAPAPAPAPMRRTPPPPSDNPEVARAQIEATRARMSETIDEIEDVLLRKKQRLREKLDVLAPVRERPLQAIGTLFGLGLALGLLTGGGGHEEEEEEEEDEEDEAATAFIPVQDDDDEEEEDDEAAEAWERAEMWEDRARRLLRIAQAQESELEVHRERQSTQRRRRMPWREEEEEPENFFDRIRDVAAERLSGLIGDITQRMSRH